MQQKPNDMEEKSNPRVDKICYLGSRLINDGYGRGGGDVIPVGGGGRILSSFMNSFRENRDSSKNVREGQK